MAFAIDTYTGNGSTTSYSVTFPYIEKAHVVVTVDGVTKSLTTDYTFTNSSTITFNTAPASSTTIKFTRKTSRSTRLVDYQDGSTLTEATLDQDGNQSFYMAQEAIDVTEGTMNVSTSTDQWDATNKRITNVADPVNNNDAVNKSYISTNIPNITTVAGISSDVTTVAGISSNVTTVASNNSNVTTVASNISNINTVATNISDVVTVANDLNEAISEIETAANDLNEATSEIDTVSNNITNVNNVGNNIANVNTVAANDANITTVAGIDTDVTSVAGVASSVPTVAGISANVTTVAGVSSDVTTVAGISSDVSTVSSNNANVTSVAGAITNINNVGNNITNVNTVATNLSGVNSFAERYRVQAGVPSTDNDVGDLVFDQTAGKLKVFDGSSYQLAGSSVNGTSSRYIYTATAGQTTFSGADDDGNTLAYDVASGTAFADIYLNGVKLAPSDFTATNGTSIVLGSGASLNDIFQVVAYGTFELASFSASNLTSGTISLDRLPSITNAKLSNSSITINGSAVSLGGSVTVGETKPTVSSISPSTIDNTATAVTITGTNFVSVPQVEAINSTGGVTLADSVSFTNSTTIVATFTLPTDGTYFIRIENNDGNAVRSSTALLTVSDAPTWTTSAGSLGSIAAGDTVNLSVAATSDSTVAYSETTSVLTSNANTPAGTMNLSLNSSTGAITGTAPSPTSETTYNFTLRATDDESQTADRAFSITVTVGINNGGQFN